MGEHCNLLLPHKGRIIWNKQREMIYSLQKDFQKNIILCADVAFLTSSLSAMV